MGFLWFVVGTPSKVPAFVATTAHRAHPAGQTETVLIFVDHRVRKAHGEVKHMISAKGGEGQRSARPGAWGL